MIARLKAADRLHVTVSLFIMTFFCIALSSFRYMMTGAQTYQFLVWNLFLAFVPWCISSLLVMYKTKSRILLTVLIVAWLLLYPNSPYILTDLFHLHKGRVMPMWFDLVLILSFAWTGLMYGFSSLRDIESLLSTYVKRWYVVVLSVVFMFISAFGIYIGRYLRWNSWDIITNPALLMYDIGDRFLHPFQHSRTWGVTIMMGLLLNMMYFSFKYFKQNVRNEEIR